MATRNETSDDTTTYTTGGSSGSSKFPKSALLTDDPTGTAEKRWPYWNTYMQQYAATLGNFGIRVLSGKVSHETNERPIRPEFSNCLVVCPNGNAYSQLIDVRQDWENPDFPFAKYTQPARLEDGLQYWGRMKEWRSRREKITITDGKLASVVSGNVGEDILEVLRREGVDMTKGRKMYVHLEVEYGGSDDVTRRVDTKAFLQIKVEPSETLKVFLARAAKLVREINSSGTPTEQKDIKTLLGKLDKILELGLSQIETFNGVQQVGRTAAQINAFWLEAVGTFATLLERSRSLIRSLDIKANEIVFITPTTEWHTLVAALTDKCATSSTWKDTFSTTLDSHVAKHSPFKEIARALLDVVKIKGEPSSSSSRSRSNRTGTDAGSFVGEYVPGDELCPIHGGHSARACKAIKKQLNLNPGATLAQIKSAVKRIKSTPCEHCGSKRCPRGDTCFGRSDHPASDPNHRLHSLWKDFQNKLNASSGSANFVKSGERTAFLGALKTLNQRLSSLEGDNTSMVVTPPKVTVKKPKKATGLFAGTSLQDEVWMLEDGDSQENEGDLVENAGILSDDDSSSVDPLEWHLTGDPRSRELIPAHVDHLGAWMDVALLDNYEDLDAEDLEHSEEGAATNNEGNATQFEEAEIAGRHQDFR